MHVIYCIVFILIALYMIFPLPAEAYIDSGRGSTLIQRLAVFVMFLCIVSKRILRIFHLKR